jgi:hypothetical protein
VPIYMYTSGFIGPSARSLAPVWPNICTRCHIDQVIALFCAVITYLCFIPEFYCFYQRKMEDFFHPEEKVTSEFFYFYFLEFFAFIFRNIYLNISVLLVLLPVLDKYVVPSIPSPHHHPYFFFFFFFFYAFLYIYTYIHASSLWV